jgi:ubiquinone/menaquinone biosynthesis C-methylase UbiE
MKEWIKIERIPGVLASAYEKATRMVIESYYRPVAAEIVAHLNEGTILDMGTGPGYLPVEIAKRSPALTVIGVDLSRKLIEIARSNASKAGLADQLTFKSGNAGRLEFSDSSFDMVISTGMLHSLKEPVAVLQEIHRVLKAGREAWIFDPARVASRVGKHGFLIRPGWHHGSIVKNGKHLLRCLKDFFFGCLNYLVCTNPSKPIRANRPSL